VIPTPLWLLLFFAFAVIVVYLLFFADSGERTFVQAPLMGSVVATIVALLLLLRFFDHPYEPGVGSLRSVAMERTLVILDQQLRVAGQSQPPPCDASGTSR
jgi:sugar phosphate permease